jgi:hypothetical protein
VTVSQEECILGDTADRRILADEFVIFEPGVKRVSDGE